MPKNTYGPQVKARVKRLLEALLAFVNYEFEQSFDIELNREAQDSTNPKVIFKTTLVALEQLIAKDKYPGKLKKEQIREALKLLENFLKILKDNRTKTQGSDDWHFTLTLWSKDREKNLQQFDKAWEDSRPDKSKAVEASFKKSDAFDWQNICLAMLEAEKPLTTNQLMRDEDDRFDLEEIHVPLALVEGKKPDKRGEEIQPEQGSRLYEPEYEEKQRFEHEQFLQDILKDGKGKHNGKRIAIIGEPGAGKTTLLRKIAFWVKDNTEYFPISISLADLQEFTLEDYLLRVWLKTAMKVRQVTPEMEDALCELFKSERVWLLLDSVDEMPVQGEEPLWAISNQLKGWVAQTRVVLTCRLNVWEANRNVLADNFEIYRTLDFSYGDSTTPDRVEEFIAKWFNKEPNLGQQLRQELDKPEKERIKDLAKNPLRLALLCSTWKLWRDRGGLPDTKAKLYQGFVEKFYQWKSREFRTDSTQQEQLNRALGELAKLAIDQTASRFRLKHSLVCKVLGKPDQPLYKLAVTQLNWLNNVGLAAETPDERVYAFWHPTFEEYFAAVAVDDWDDFLPREHKDRPVKDHSGKYKPYRIFEQQWKEVILLWLGRQEERLSKQKEEFIKALVEFEDGCDEFYRYRAYFLAAAGITEFIYCNFADLIVDQIVQKSFGYFSDYKQEWVTFVVPIAEAARAIIGETDRTKAINTLLKLIHNTLNENVRCLAASSLCKIEQTNQVANSVLLQIIQNSQNHSIRRLAASILGEIDKFNSAASHTLLELISNCKDENIRWLAAASLIQIGQSNQVVHAALLELIQTSQDKNVRNLACGIMVTISQSEPLMVDTIENIIRQSKSEDNRKMLAGILWQIDPYNSEAICTLIELKIKLNTNEDMVKTTSLLKKIDKSSPIKISILEELMPTLQNEESRKLVADILWQIDQNNCVAIDTFLDLLENSDDASTRCLAADRLSGNNKHKSTVIRILVEIINQSQEEWIRRSASDILLKIDQFNCIALAVLVDILNNSQDDFILQLAIASLEKTSKDSPEVITALLNLIKNSQSETTRQVAASCLSKIAKNNEMVITALLDIVKNCQNGSTCWQAVYSLINLLTEVQMPRVITELKDYCFNNVDCFEACYQLIWHCAQTLPYLKFYAAWNMER